VESGEYRTKIGEQIFDFSAHILYRI